MPKKSGINDSPFPKNITFCFRITPEAKEKLSKIAQFTDAVSDTDLVRSWVREKIEEYENNPRYQEWMTPKDASQ